MAVNISTATKYAEHGYSIYRSEWADNTDGKIDRSIKIVGKRYISNTPSPIEKELHYILLPEDCLADDWKLIL